MADLVGGVNSARKQDSSVGGDASMFALALSTWKKRFRTEYRLRWEEKSKVKERHTERNKAKNREATTNNQPLIMDGMRMV